MAVKIQLRGDTAANWTTANPVLASREMAIETDTLKLKVGNGIQAWSDLLYITGDSGDTHFLGAYTNEAALTTAHATAEPGDYAYVDAGVGNPVEMWIWDDDDDEWVASGTPAGGTWGSITGTLADQTDLQAALDAKFSNAQARATRTVTGADSLVQSDDNSLIIFNSATPFNFTLDQLTAGSKVQFMNINTGVVTFVDGTGVTVAPTAPTLMGAGSGVFPGAFVFYTSATTPILSSAYPESWLDYTPTFTGFSVNPTGITARYTLIGKTCTVRLHMTPGTSNDVGQTITLPFTSKGRNSYSILVTNNGVTQFGRCDTLGSSNILTVYATAAGGAFTNTGNKGCFFVLTYEIE